MSGSPNHPDASHNLPVLTVGELSGALKRTVEETYARVRVRGEISGFKRAGSGHLYLCLKDSDAVLDAVCWRGTAQRLAVAPEDGLEVIATGRLTTYPGRSKYQVVIESLELAGEGALLKLLEDRRRRLAEEGLFDPGRKRPLPFLPRTIGVVTSPTGAVIRDILHRLADRFPSHVLLWPVRVQGDSAAGEVAEAIAGFNALPAGGSVPRPDVLIVARGGGSLEDLWAFNEEVVVRAAAASDIPLISAVGHETDTTLIDHAADRRAPTPTAAAEMAVPVRMDLLAQVMDDATRLFGAMGRMLAERSTRVQSLARGLPNLGRVVEDMSQRLDDRAERLDNAARAGLRHRAGEVARLGAGLVAPGQKIAAEAARVGSEWRALERAYHGFVTGRGHALERCSDRLRPAALEDARRRGLERLETCTEGLERAGARILGDAGQRLGNLSGLLESYGYEQVLARGFALVRDDDGAPLSSAKGLETGARLQIEFADGTAPVVVDRSRSGARRVRPKAKGDDKQGTLL